MPNENCVFCKIVAGTIPSTKIYEDDTYFAFMDIMPAVKGHTLVIPKDHYKAFLDVPEKIVGGLAETVQKVAKAVEKTTKAQGLKIETFNGEHAGQTVPHVHFHIIPRYEGDAMEYRQDKNWWLPKKDMYQQGELQQFAEKIRNNL